MAETIIKPTPMTPKLAGAFLLYFAALLPVLAWQLYELIDANLVPVARNTLQIPAGATRADTLAAVQRAGSELVLSPSELLLAVVITGAIGSYIHAVTSFTSYAGNRKLYASWGPWYFLRPLVGVAMAVLFYLVVRGGVLVLSGGVSEVDPYAIMTVAALAGMFSKQASDKLADVFDTLFRSRADQERKDKLDNPVPEITGLAPESAKVGDAAMFVTVTGSGFVEGSKGHVDGQERETKVKSSTELTVKLTTVDLAKEKVLEITVVNPEPGGGTSNTREFTVSVAQEEDDDDDAPELLAATMFGEKLRGPEKDDE